MLARLEKIKLRDIWKSESQDFTPWLAQAENIAILSEEINIDLEVQAKEKSVGPFKADILCKNTLDSTWVLVENQLEKTDHTHLGQLLTYAAGLHAVTIIWIAESFTEEHRAALDWLNEHTPESINFFGIQIELYKIGDSKVAPKFNIICKPNNWSRIVSEAARGIANEQVSDLKLLQRDYWQVLMDHISQNSKLIKAVKALPQHWSTFPIGRSNFVNVAFVNSKEKRYGVHLTINGLNAKAQFADLLSQKDIIEKEADLTFEWEELPDAKESRIRFTQLNTDITDKHNWQVMAKWHKDHLEIIDKVFRERIKKLS